MKPKIMSIKEMFNDEECAGWIFYDKNWGLDYCWGGPSNDLGIENELPLNSEEDDTDKIYVEQKILIGDDKNHPNLYVYMGRSASGVELKDIPQDMWYDYTDLLSEIAASWGY